MSRDSEVLQRQHFCHNGDTHSHPKSCYVTTKLYGTSTRGCNNKAIFLDGAIGLYREYAIAIQDEVGDSNGGNV